MTDNLLEVRDLVIDFKTDTGTTHAVRNCSFTVKAGETLAIIGESGCGKTVLLKSMIGLIPPLKGSILFDHQDLARLKDRELTRQRQRFGFVFQNAALFDSLTVGQNVAFPLRQHFPPT